MTSSNQGSKDTLLQMKKSSSKLLSPETFSTPNAEGVLSPSAGCSNNVFCTSSEDVLTAFNFSKDTDSETYAWDEAQGQDTARITLVCGDLFQNVCRNANSFASILQEPQNKSLLQNFLDDFTGKHLVPWAIGAALKHWGIKLGEKYNRGNDHGTPDSIPYLKTTQTLTQKGEVDDPKALERLEEVVKEYFFKVEQASPYNQAVQSLGTFVNYICDSEDPAPYHLAAGHGQSQFSRPPNVQKAYEEILDELRQAEQEIVELEAEARQSLSTASQKESNSFLLHRIAGFDSFVGIPTPMISREANVAISSAFLSLPLQRSHDSLSATVFSKPTGMLTDGYTSSAEHLTVEDSEDELSLAKYGTIRATPESTYYLHESDDKNGNFSPATANGTMENDFVGLLASANDEITDEILERIWSADPAILELASDVERAAMDIEQENDASLSEDINGNTSKQEPVQDTPKVIAPVAKPKAVEVAKSSMSVHRGRKFGQVAAKVISRKLAQPTPAPAPKENSVKSKISQINSNRPRWNVSKPQAPRARSSSVGKVCLPKRNVTKPAPKPQTKLAYGCHRIEFTKVNQTVSYRQLNQESLQQLRQPTPKSKSPVRPGTIPTSTPAVEMPTAVPVSALADAPVTVKMPTAIPVAVPSSSSSATTAKPRQPAPPRGRGAGSTAKPSDVTSRTTSVPKSDSKPLVGFRSKPTLGYAALNQQKKGVETSGNSLSKKGNTQLATSVKAQGHIQ